MDIQDIEKTPNPSSMKFVLDRGVSGPYTVSYEEGEEQAPGFVRSLLAFFDEIEEISLQQNHAVVSLEGDERWHQELLDEVKSFLRQADHGSDEGGSLFHDSVDPDQDPRLMLIEETLEEEILPYLQSHGGGLQITGFEGDTLEIKYQGACGGCPISLTQTMNGIKSLLQEEVDPDLSLSLHPDSLDSFV